ncbi:MAG: cytochrome c [Flavobacteriales bacterium]|nr:cytochrome c [Flavobacteriales bacterium]
MKKSLIILAAFGFILVSCGGNENAEPATTAHAGKENYDKQCARCHGSNGKMGLSGAKDLTDSKLTPAEMIPIITNGSSGGIMPAYKDVLSESQIAEVADYIEKHIKN